MFKTSVSKLQFHYSFLDSDWGQNWELSVGTLEQRLSLDCAEFLLKC